MRLTTRHIAELVALQTGVPVADLVRPTGRCRVPSYARHLVMWAARRSDGHLAYGDGRRTYAVICSALGGCDHTTVLYGVRRVDRHIAASAWWRDAAGRLMATIRGLERDDPVALALLAAVRDPPAPVMRRALKQFAAACREVAPRRRPLGPVPRERTGQFKDRSSWTRAAAVTAAAENMPRPAGTD
jgi:DnaA-like protein